MSRRLAKEVKTKLGPRLQQLRQEIFGHMPQLGIRQANKWLSKQLLGPYLARYYPDPIEKAARKGSVGLPPIPTGHTQFFTAKEERRLIKLEVLRRRGKGPPKKGAGRRRT